MKYSRGKNLASLLLLAVGGVLLVWGLFWFRIGNPWGINLGGGIEAVWSNFDGANYLIVAKTWYDKELIRLSFSNPLPLEYYPAHWPFYPFLIAIFNLMFSGPWAMLAAALVGLVFFYFVLVKFLESYGLGDRAVFWLTLTSLVLPARWIAVRSVGSAEAWFMGFILLSLMAYRDKKYLLAGVWGALAQLSKSPAILLFAAYGIHELVLLVGKQSGWGQLIGRLLKVSLIPATILAVFYFYYLRTGDFWAYLNSGDNLHLFWPPFSVFGKGGVWVGDFWLEDLIWLWLIYGLGIWQLFKENKFRLLAIFGAVFFTTTLFISHRDISRYILPIMPLALLGWRETIVKRDFAWLLLLLVLPALLFSLNFIANNIAPVADWTPYL